jgi:ribosomal protein S27AE
MSAAIELLPLFCTRCGTPVPAGPDEVAWTCGTCGQGLALDEEKGVRPLDVFFAAPASGVEASWMPFWVAIGKVRFERRETYGRDRGPDDLWGSPQTFVLPAFDCSLEEAGGWGLGFLRNPPRLAPGPAAALPRVTVGAEEARTLGEFVVLTVEAERRDQLKAVAFQLDLEPPVLWALPFTGPEGGRQLALAAG